MRDIEKGTWFISTLCSKIQRHAHEQDMLSILTSVTSEIAKKTAWVKGRYKCAPEMQSNFSKHLFFKPKMAWTAYCKDAEKKTGC